MISLKNLQNQNNQSKKEKKKTLKNAIILLNGRSKVLNTFESAIFPKRKQGKGLASILDKVFNHKQFKTLTPKQMIQKLPIALPQAKGSNTSEI